MVATLPRTSQAKRLLELDVLRGLAALSVVLYHYTTRYNQIYGHSEALLFRFPDGKYGVSLFFIISGFVILMSLERTTKSLDFVVGRFARLYPTYWAAMSLTFIVVSLFGLPGREIGLRYAILNFTMFQGFFNIPDVDWVYWTLRIELSFYVVMILLYQFKLLRHISAVSIGWLLLMAIAYLVKTHTSLFIPEIVNAGLVLDHANLFVLGLVLYKSKQDGFSVITIGIILASLLIHGIVNSWESALIVSLFVFLFYLIIKGHLAFICFKPLIFLGTISYALYLVHQNVGYVIIRSLYQFGVNPNTSIFIAIVISIGLATAITSFIERPALRYIKEQYRRRILKESITG